MANLHRLRETLLAAYCTDILDEDEFVLLYDVNKPSNADFRYGDYEPINLESLNDDECNSYFRFQKNDIHQLKTALQIPNKIKCANGTRIDGTNALCITLNRYAFPTRYGDMVKHFGISVPQLCLTFNCMTDFLYHTFNEPLYSTLEQHWLSPQCLEMFSQAVTAKGAAITNCWGFVDGTVRLICRPSQHQRVMFNGLKRQHALKFQSVVAANGLIAHLYGPVEGRCHDCFLLRQSGLLEELEVRSFGLGGDLLCIYGDPAYPIRGDLQSPFRAPTTPDQDAYNKSMAMVRTSVEWLFGDIVEFFKFIDFKKTQKVCLSSCGKMYSVCGLLTNAHTCLYGNKTSKFFEVEPPILEEYLQAN